MRDQFDKFLATAYPELFTDSDDPTKSLMGYGCSHGDGWFSLVNHLCHSITEHQNWTSSQRQYAINHNTIIDQAKNNDYTLAKEETYSFCVTNEQLMQRVENAVEEGYRTVPDIVKPVRVLQIKEKFGTLHFYYQGGDEYVKGLVQLAESLSGNTCEECGAPGRRRGGGWIKTLCDNHAREKDYHSDLEVEVGETVQLFTENGYENASVLNVLENNELEILDKNNATFKVRPLEIGGVNYGAYTPVDV